MKRVWLLTPMDVPGDTDPARVAEVFNRHLDDDDGLLCQWGEWLPGTARLSEAPWQPGGSGGYAYATGEGSVALGGARGSSGGNSGPWPAGGGNGSNSVVRHAHGLNELYNVGCFTLVVLLGGGGGRVR